MIVMEQLNAQYYLLVMDMMMFRFIRGKYDIGLVVIIVIFRFIVNISIVIVIRNSSITRKYLIVRFVVWFIFVVVIMFVIGQLSA